MKLNKISMMLAAMALVGCSNDFSERFADQALEDSNLIQLDSNFMLAGVGDESNITRTHWEFVDGEFVNSFLPVYSTAGVVNDPLSDFVGDENLEKIGLCLYQGGNTVLTNYEFYHYGWLNKGEVNADIPCNDLLNGSLYSDIKMKVATIVGEEANPTNDFTVPAKSKIGSEDNLNYNSGVYKTENKAIFGGSYIVYYPYNPEFKNAGTIPAVAETVIERSDKYSSKKIGETTFRYSDPTAITGGARAAGFKLHNLSTVAQLRVAAVDGDDLVGKKIDQIVLYSPSGRLLKQANLAADRIAAGQQGTDLYASSVGTNTIVVNCDYNTGYALDATSTTGAASTYITLLPTNVPDLEVLIHSNQLQKWARVEIVKDEYKTFNPGVAQRIDINVKQTDFTYDYIAVDEQSLTNALSEARSGAAADNLKTITVIGDIELESATYNINDAKDKYITIKGDAIIVPQDVTLKVKTNMESEIRVLGKSCCTGSLGGRLLVQGGTISDVTMEPTDAVSNLNNNPYVEFENSAEAIVAAGKTINVKAGNVFVNDQVKYKGNLEVAEGAKVTVMSNGALQFYDAVINNYGIIEVKKDGKFNVLDASGATEAVAGKNMTNHEGAKFIHNIDASVGGATQFMNQEGEYRCKVDQQTKLDDAYLLWTACSVIEIVAGGNYNLVNANDNNKHNSEYIDIEVNASTATIFTNPIISSGNGDSKTINIRNLIVKSELEVTYVTGSGKRTLNVNGYMDVQANTTLTSSNLVKVFDYLTVSGSSTLTYKKSNGNLVVVNDITVDHANFTTETDALNISCANFILKNAAVATFANRSSGKTMTVAGTISNPEGCTFTITPATSPNLIADITCYKLVEGGTFTNGSKPRVVARPQ